MISTIPTPTHMTVSRLIVMRKEAIIVASPIRIMNIGSVKSSSVSSSCKKSSDVPS